jgi:hypothetical protein
MPCPTPQNNDFADVSGLPSVLKNRCIPYKTRAPRSKNYASKTHNMGGAIALRAIRTAQAAIGCANTRLFPSYPPGVSHLF